MGPLNGMQFHVHPLTLAAAVFWNMKSRIQRFVETQRPLTVSVSLALGRIQKQKSEIESKARQCLTLISSTFLKCMDQSDCKEAFPKSEVRRFLPDKTVEALSKLRTENEIRKVCV